VNCFEPGRILIGPGPEWSLEVERELRAELGGSFEVLYDFSDVLRANDLFLREDHQQHRKLLPLVARVPEGAELEFTNRIRDRAFSRGLINAVVPDYLIRPESAISVNKPNIQSGIQSALASFVGPKCGENCTVGIVDSGLDLSLPFASPSVICRQLTAKDPLNAATAHSDLTGHGSLVAYIINQIAPGAKIVPVRAFDKEGSFSEVLAGLYLAHAYGPCDVINLSFSMKCDADFCSVCGSALSSNANLQQLEYFFHHFRAIAGDVTLIAAAGSNSKSIAIPAAFGGIIGAGSYHFQTLKPISNYATAVTSNYILGPDGANVIGEELGSRRGIRQDELLFGTSFATAFVSGVAARIACGLKGGKCQHSTATKNLIQQGYTLSQGVSFGLLSKADRAWQGYHPSLHGMGRLRLNWGEGAQFIWRDHELPS
jgi:hypothetical protein